MANSKEPYCLFFTQKDNYATGSAALPSLMLLKSMGHSQTRKHSSFFHSGEFRCKSGLGRFDQKVVIEKNATPA